MPIRARVDGACMCARLGRRRAAVRRFPHRSATWRWQQGRPESKGVAASQPRAGALSPRCRSSSPMTTQRKRSASRSAAARPPAGRVRACVVGLGQQGVSRKGHTEMEGVRVCPFLNLNPVTARFQNGLILFSPPADIAPSSPCETSTSYRASSRPTGHDNWQKRNIFEGYIHNRIAGLATRLRPKIYFI